MFKVRYECESVKQGDVVGKRTVIGVPFEVRYFVPSRQSGQLRILCVVQCQCGRVDVTSINNLLHARAGTCFDCRDPSHLWGKGYNITHGHSGKRLRVIWYQMKHRCENPRNIGYQRYGGRGIGVCDEWTNDYEAFESWAHSNGYGECLQIDRINNDGNYEPSNCRWLTPKQNARNRRNTLSAEAFGEIRTLTEWAEDPRCIVGYELLLKRVLTGKNVEWAMTTKSLRPWRRTAAV